MKTHIGSRRKEFSEVERTIAPGEYHTIIEEPQEKDKKEILLPFH